MKFLINGYWKDDEVHFYDYIVTSETNPPNPDYYFFEGITEDEIKKAIKDGVKSDFEFVITSYKPY